MRQEQGNQCEHKDCSLKSAFSGVGLGGHFSDELKGLMIMTEYQLITGIMCIMPTKITRMTNNHGSDQFRNINKREKGKSIPFSLVIGVLNQFLD